MQTPSGKSLRRNRKHLRGGDKSTATMNPKVSTHPPVASPESICWLSKFLKRSLMIFIIKGFRTIVFIFIVISTTFRPICPPAFRCLSNSGAFKELQSTSFIESKGVTCSDSVSHNRVQVLSIPVLCSSHSISFRESMPPPSDSAITYQSTRRAHWFLLPL